MRASRKQGLISKYLLLLLLSLLTVSTIWYTITIILDPSKRVGPFGLGIPAPMVDTTIENESLLILRPESWNYVSLPHGNHGDLEVIAMFLVPGRALPRVTIARKLFEEEDLSLVASWGEIRDQSEENMYTSISLIQNNTKYFPGLLREYTITITTPFGTSVVQCEDCYLLNNHVGYTFSFCADEHNWSDLIDTFNRMIESIRPK